MKKYLLLASASLCLTGCVIPNQQAAVEPAPVLVYTAEPIVGETIVIDRVPYYRHYVDGHVYYHHRR